MTGPRLVTGRQATDANRAAILLALAQRGPASRSELARSSGVTRTTIGSYVDALLADGLVEELPAEGTGGKGRPARPVRLRADAGLTGTATIDVGGVEAALVNARGEVVRDASSPLPSSVGPEEVAALVARLLGEVGATERAETAVGVVVGTAVDRDTQTLLPSGRVPAVDGTRFVPALRAAMRGQPVVVENDARASALAELWWGRGGHGEAFWSIQVGEGIGAAAIVDGELLQGRWGAAGEIGHTYVGGDRRCGCGRRGCWETGASLRWLRSEARRRGLPGGRSLDAGRLAARVVGGDEAARALLDDLAANLAVGLANLVHTVGPQPLVLQGEVVAGGEVVRAAIEQALLDRVLDHMRDRVVVDLSVLGPGAGLLGGAATVLSERWSPRPG